MTTITTRTQSQAHTRRNHLTESTYSGNLLFTEPRNLLQPVSHPGKSGLFHALRLTSSGVSTTFQGRELANTIPARGIGQPFCSGFELPALFVSRAQ